MTWLTDFLYPGKATGSWKGYFKQIGHQFPVELILKHRGRRVWGRMNDLEVHRSGKLRMFLESSGMQKDQVDAVIEQLRGKFPTPGRRGEIDYQAWLPKRSVVDGKVDESSFSFTKRYKGRQKIEYRLGGESLTQKMPPAKIQYDGAFSEDWCVMKGKWSISVVGSSEVLISDEFYLERVE